MSQLHEATAWDSIGWDDGDFRIKGGRAVYEGVLYNCSNGGRLVKLARIEVLPGMKLRQVNRYVDPDTVLVFDDEIEITDIGVRRKLGEAAG